MRLDHFVLFNNHKTLSNNTGNTMPNNALTTPSITKSRGFQSSHNVWVQRMRFNPNSNHTRVWGRIQDTGANYIVEGWEIGKLVDSTQWVRIPCANLATAQMHLISIMDKDAYQREKTRQANGI